MMILRYFFKTAFIKKHNSFALLYAAKPALYSFRFGSAGDSKYSFISAFAGSCHRFTYALNRGRGLWRFKLNCRPELFYENPLHSFMYPLRELDYTNKLHFLMYQTRTAENAPLRTLLDHNRPDITSDADALLSDRTHIDTNSNDGISALLSSTSKNTQMPHFSPTLSTLSPQTAFTDPLKSSSHNETQIIPNDALYLGIKPHQSADTPTNLFSLTPEICSLHIFPLNTNLEPLYTHKNALFEADEPYTAQKQHGELFLKTPLHETAEIKRISQISCESEKIFESEIKEADALGEFLRAVRENIRDAIKTLRGLSAVKVHGGAVAENFGSLFIRLRIDVSREDIFTNSFVRLRKDMRFDDTHDLFLFRSASHMTTEQNETLVRRRISKKARGSDNLFALERPCEKDLSSSSDFSTFGITPEKDAHVPWVLFSLDLQDAAPQILMITEGLFDRQTLKTSARETGCEGFFKNSRCALTEGETAALIERFCEAAAGDMVLLTPEAAFFIAETFNDVSYTRELEGDIETERRLTLWKRLWFLAAEDDCDRIILPSLDYPYESSPITFDGFDDLVPDNYNVVFPDSFWRGVSYHPVRGGSELGTSEIPLAINIMVEMINIIILMWSRFYRAFWGWTGSQAVLGITAEVLALLTLESSRAEQDAKGSRSHYDRCFRWLRWEAEKVALSARNDMELRGNFYVGILLEELVSYMLHHHFDVMPLFRDIDHMDNWRRLFGSDLQRDITWTLDKVKGIRHKLLGG